MRTPFLENHYYHIYNRGNMKQVLFHEPSDYARFLFAVLHFQSPVPIFNITRFVKNFLHNGNFGVTHETMTEVDDTRYVELINFCIMPNHFHLTVKALTGDGISKYMHRVGNSHAQYFSKKYKTSGHVFQGTYKTKEITSDKQLCYLSSYIHRNPCEISTWKSKPENYLWSSLQDYENNRWGTLLKTVSILEQFDNYADYLDYCNNSGAKSNLLGT